LGRVGCGEDIVAPWWAHGISRTMISLLPGFLLDSSLISIGTKQKAEADKKIKGT